MNSFDQWCGTGKVLASRSFPNSIGTRSPGLTARRALIRRYRQSKKFERWPLISPISEAVRAWPASPWKESYPVRSRMLSIVKVGRRIRRRLRTSELALPGSTVVTTIASRLTAARIRGLSDQNVMRRGITPLDVVELCRCGCRSHVTLDRVEDPRPLHLAAEPHNIVRQMTVSLTAKPLDASNVRVKIGLRTGSRPIEDMVVGGCPWGVRR
jgi:hypothetical protein